MPLLALLMVAGCPSDDIEGSGVLVHPSTGAPPGNGPIGGGVATGSGNPTPVPTATPSVEPTTPPATPKPTAPPKVVISSVQVSDTYLLLYPPPQDPTKSLGYPSSLSLSGIALRDDGFQAPVRWVVGEHLTYGGGKIATKTSTPPGIHYVRCEAVDDPNVFQDVAIEVRTTSELGVIVQ